MNLRDSLYLLLIRCEETDNTLRETGITVCENSYQEITMRGHREDDMSTNKGNFLEILSLVAKHDEVVKSRLNFFPRNAQYTSPKIQNDYNGRHDV